MTGLKNFDNNRLVDHFQDCDLFCDLQYGFRSSQSTVDLLAVVFDRITWAFNMSWATLAVMPNISKAFDRLCHAGLFHKLKLYEISGEIFGFISSFFSNRRPQVVLGGKSSQEYPDNSGIPQVSILDPTLFLIGSSLMTFRIILSVILLSVLMILLSTLSVIKRLICDNDLELVFELESDLLDTVE